MPLLSKPIWEILSEKTFEINDEQRIWFSNQHDKAIIIVFSLKAHDSPSYHQKFGDTVIGEATSLRTFMYCIRRDTIHAKANLICIRNMVTH